MTTSPPSDVLAARIRLAALTLRWSMLAMVVAAAVGWYAASRDATGVLRVALLAGTAAFLVSVACFVWFALLSAKLRAR